MRCWLWSFLKVRYFWKPLSRVRITLNFCACKRQATVTANPKPINELARDAVHLNETAESDLDGHVHIVVSHRVAQMLKVGGIHVQHIGFNCRLQFPLFT